MYNWSIALHKLLTHAAAASSNQLVDTSGAFMNQALAESFVIQENF